MATHVVPDARSTRTPPAGTITLVLGILFSAAVAFAFPLSLSDTFNPPDWVRLLGLVWLPIGLAGVPTGYVLARDGSGRERARLGVVVALVGLLAFAGLVIAVG
jgi:protein-S-isoprenylcysteine O-methyltransferase Ste14